MPPQHQHAKCQIRCQNEEEKKQRLPLRDRHAKKLLFSTKINKRFQSISCNLHFVKTEFINTRYLYGACQKQVRLHYYKKIEVEKLANQFRCVFSLIVGCQLICKIGARAGSFGQNP